MSEIIEILGEKKFSGSINRELKTRIVFEENKKIKTENNLFFDISQQNQYLKEKRLNNNFKIYGKITPIINTDVHEKSVNNKDFKIELDKNIFNLNLENWSIVILKSKRVKQTINDVTKELKGYKNIKINSNEGKVILDFDLNRGLPGRVCISDDNLDNFCIFLPLGHNFFIGDKVLVDSLNEDLLDSKLYEVVNIEGNKIFLNTKPIKNFLEIKKVENTNSIVTSLNEYILVNQNNKKIKDQGLKQKLNNLIFSKEELELITNTSRPDIQTIIKPDFYLSKIVEKEKLEYYLKTLEVIAVTNQLDLCGFSINSFNQEIFNFFINEDININDSLDNINEPLTDLYIGIIKNAPQTPDLFSKVESHFSNFIENIDLDYGLETITDFSGNSIINRGYQFIHSLCEYSTENLNEKEINYINHRFIHKNILFSYNPFTKVKLKIKSEFIESAEEFNEIPNYAIYSKQKEKYIWRDILDIGVSDDEGNVINFPFTNGCFYVYNDINFYLKPETKNTRKYKVNFNDISSIEGSDFTNEFDNIFDDQDIKPFNEYIDDPC